MKLHRFKPSAEPEHLGYNFMFMVIICHLVISAFLYFTHNGTEKPLTCGCAVV